MNIFEAIEKKDNILLKKLIIKETNIDKNIKNIYGISAIGAACFVGDVDCLEILLVNYFPLTIITLNSYTTYPIHVLSSRGHIECLDLLLKRGYPVNLFDSFGRTALWEASRCGKIECIKLLLQFGADIDLQDDSGNTALHASVLGNEVKAYNMLIEVGANISIKNDDGYFAYELFKLRS